LNIDVGDPATRAAAVRQQRDPRDVIQSGAKKLRK